jgi:hypothetical protein
VFGVQPIKNFWCSFSIGENFNSCLCFGTSGGRREFVSCYSLETVPLEVTEKGRVAQLEEHRAFNLMVVGSNPVTPIFIHSVIGEGLHINRTSQRLHME